VDADPPVGNVFLQLFNLCVNILNLLLYIIVVLAQDLFASWISDAAGVAPFRGRFAVSFMVRPVIKPITAITIR
jgi:hypothetical protein